MQNKKLEYFQIGMFLINAIAVLLIAFFIYITTGNIRAHFNARQFLSGVSAIPRDPSANIVFCGLLLMLLAGSFFLRKTVLPPTSGFIGVSFVVDFAVSFFIVYILNFNYNGILLFVFANVVAYSKGNKARSALMMLALASFLFTDYELVAINYRLYSIRSYIAYYSPDIQQYLFSIYNGLISLNISLFILYCIYEISSQQGTIDEVNYLYQKLSEANQDLENANQQLMDYASITEKMGETRERNRLAREIHDTLGHTLTGISAGIDASITMLDKSPEDTRKQLEVISRVTREGIVDVRRSVGKLRVDSLQRLNLEHGITKMIADMRAVTDAKIYFTNHIGKLRFDEDEENAIYRVIQESLTNAIRHGKATKVWVELERVDDRVLMKVEDNGKGCAEITSGFGTRHIRERINMLGGKVTFDGNDGFKVIGEIPIRWGEQYDKSIDCRRPESDPRKPPGCS